jgi:outer membrane protein
MRRQTPWIGFRCGPAVMALAVVILGSLGCHLVDRMGPKDPLITYQRTMADPQPRVDTEGKDASHPLGILEHPQSTPPTEDKAVHGPNAPGPRTFHLTLDQAITKVLSNSPEVRIVSLDASVAEQLIIKSKADLDPTAFGRYNYEKTSVPTTTSSEISQSDVRTLESGVKQKITTGAEWSFSYVLTRSWDDLYYRNPAKRFEPVLAFQIKQPLMRDGSREVTLAGIDVAHLNHQIALLGFRQKAEDLCTAVITAYWQLTQAREDLRMQRQLLDMASETFGKVEGRRAIDATDVQIQQALVNVRARQAQFLQAQRQVTDAQDILARLLADPQMDLLHEYEIVPDTPPTRISSPLEPNQVLQKAIQDNPVLSQARLGVQIADINLRVARNQEMPRLDLVASTSKPALSSSINIAHDGLMNESYHSYAIGVIMEYPLGGNRQREAEWQKRRLERKKAVATVQNLADQVAVQARERMRRVQTSFAEIQVQQLAVEAANIQLQAIADSEPVRDKLTPEFLLVKLQAQESLSESLRAQARTIAEYNIALAELAQTTGSALSLHPIELPGQDTAAPEDLPSRP